MKCPKCNQKNIVKATFCKSCKYEFSEEEQEKAYKKTLFGKLEFIENWYNHLTLSTITDHILFKILLVLIVLGVGLYYYFTRGIDTAILESDSYVVYHNSKSDEYYLLVDDNVEDIELNLYVPNRVKELKLEHYNTDDKLIDNLEYEEENEMKLKVYNNDYYKLKSKYNKKEDTMKIFIYPKNRVDIDK